MVSLVGTVLHAQQSAPVLQTNTRAITIPDGAGSVD
jgi:hypothetical protein